MTRLPACAPKSAVPADRVGQFRVMVVAAVFAGVLPAGGCISASLATSTGPKPAGFKWSVEPKQKVHVGETVDFDLVLLDAGRGVRPDDVANYAVLLIGDLRYQTESDLHGHYTFSHRFDGVRPGDTIPVTAAAFRDNGQRDFMNIAGDWMMSAHPDNVPDRRVAGDSMTLIVYQASIDLAVVAPTDELAPHTGVLELTRADGSTRLVYPAAPNKPGYGFARGDGGAARVYYRPRWDEVSPSGQTQAEFRIHDRAGTVHRTTATIETP